MVTAPSLQQGIYHEAGRQPPRHFRLLLVDAVRSASRDSIATFLKDLKQVLDGFRAGEVPELSGANEEATASSLRQFEDLEWLLGFGRRLFDHQAHDSPLVDAERPSALAYLDWPGPAFPSLPWDSETTENLGEGDFCLQFTADNEAAVNLAVVETWKLLADQGHPLQARTMFSGFGRPDGRGWLEFHDGVSNMESSQRAKAITSLVEPAWMKGGTYLAFLRIAIDLASWRTLSRPEQEILVGRDKLSGRPLSGIERDPSGDIIPVASAPLNESSTDLERTFHRDPPQTAEPILEASHTHRANQNRASPDAPGGLRIFRQGYDFLDGISPGGPRVGLNFVSFQADLLTLQHILHLPGWLADVNFGGSRDPGPGEPAQRQLLTLSAGGFYAVPPVADPFPGATILGP